MLLFCQTVDKGWSQSARRKEEINDKATTSVWLSGNIIKPWLFTFCLYVHSERCHESSISFHISIRPETKFE